MAEEEEDFNSESKEGSCNNNSKAKKMPWSEKEDKLVIRLVGEHGP